MRKVLFLAVIITFTSFTAYADFDFSRWQYKKVLEGTQVNKDGYAVFEIGPEIFNGSLPDLRDLRVVDNQGNETQYYLFSENKLNTQVQREAVILKREEQKKATYLTLDLKYFNLPVNALEISSDDVNYNRKIKMEAGNQLQDLHECRYGNIYSYNLDNIKLNESRIEFDEIPCRYIKLTISNEDNQPLTIRNISVFGEIKKGVFKVKPAQDYFVYYGYKNAQKPQYEINSIIPYLNSYQLPEYKLGPEQKNEKYAADNRQPQQASEEESKDSNTKTYLILTLLGMCTILGIIILRTFKKSIAGNKND